MLLIQLKLLERNQLKYDLGIGVLGYFTSLTFVFNFIVLIFIMMLYDFISSRRLYMYENFISIILISFLISYLNLSLLLLALIVFISMFIGSIVGGLLKMYTIKMHIKRNISGAIFLIVIIIFAYVVLLHTNYFAPPHIVSNIDKPYLTKLQLSNIFGSGGYSENLLSITTTGIGGSFYVFPTPIKEDLLYNVSLADISANGGFLTLFYNFTFINNSRIMYDNITSQTWNTNQASLLFSHYALSLKGTPNTYINLGSKNGMGYILEEGVLNNTMPSFLILAQKSNYITFISCYGILCTNKNALSLVNQTSNDI